MGQFTAVALPQRENAGQSVAQQPLLAVAAHVLQKDVAANHPRDARRSVAVQGRAHPALVLVVAALRRNAHLLQRITQCRRLLFEQARSHAVHADALVFGRHGGEQSDNIVFSPRPRKAPGRCPCRRSTTRWPFRACSYPPDLAPLAAESLACEAARTARSKPSGTNSRNRYNPRPPSDDVPDRPSLSASRIAMKSAKATSADHVRRPSANLAAFVVGVPLAVASSGLIHYGPLHGTPVYRYFEHKVEWVELLLFCCAVSVLGAKWVQSLIERRAFQAGALPPWDGRARADRRSGQLAGGPARVPRACKTPSLSSASKPFSNFSASVARPPSWTIRCAPCSTTMRSTSRAVMP